VVSGFANVGGIPSPPLVNGRAIDRKARVVLLFAVVALVCACARDEPRPTDNASSAGATGSAVTLPADVTGPSVVGTFALTGAVEIAGDFSVVYPVNDERLNRCDRIAGSEATSYVPPTPTISGEVRLNWLAAVRRYRGPGSYALVDFESVSVEILSPLSPDARRFASDGATTVTLVVDATNNGSLTFANLKDFAGQALSGSFMWTCR
jgi:hypothetical protein